MRRNAGFTLIEMMVAMAIGLIVIGAVTGLVLSIIRSNNETIQATRLTQELRATAAVIMGDIKRAGGVVDPLTAATANAGKPLNPFATISSTAGCLRYAYANGAGGEFHAISVRDGAVFLDAAPTAADATCDGGTRLSSSFVTINTLTFARTGRRIEVVMQGSLTSHPTIRRTFSQMVFVRSVAGS
ncbi:PilW family protein [Lysobacter korlensis]|uniref:PilW family protein n=1 Tax=Lysobacter korlensis TaxID=553636 RepID=A0ABV6RPI9_9GAMM